MHCGVRCASQYTVCQCQAIIGQLLPLIFELWAYHGLCCCLFGQFSISSFIMWNLSKELSKAFIIMRFYVDPAARKGSGKSLEPDTKVSMISSIWVPLYFYNLSLPFFSLKAKSCYGKCQQLYIRHIFSVQEIFGIVLPAYMLVGCGLQSLKCV